MEAVSDAKVLVVDDDPAMLRALQRVLRGRVALEVTERPENALQLIAKNGPYAVIVSDMRMPSMTGAELLAEVRAIAPDTVRIMLTGNVDQETAKVAINQGGISVLLNKPVDPDRLIAEVLKGIESYKSAALEQDIMERTTSGSMRLIVELLAFSDPGTFEIAVRSRDLAKSLAASLQVRNAWEVEIGAMMNQLGRLILPRHIFEQIHDNQDLSYAELEALDKLPKRLRQLVNNIPRLSGVAELLYYVRQRFDGTGIPGDGVRGDRIPIGARIIAVAEEIVRMEQVGISRSAAVETMSARRGFYDPAILEAARGQKGQLSSAGEASEQRAVILTLAQLLPGHMFLTDVYTREGVLLITAGNIATGNTIERLRNHSRLSGVKEPFRVDSEVPIR